MATEVLFPTAPAKNRRELVASHHYVERPRDMAVVEEHLIPRSSGDTSTRIFVLYGLGGIGKTQLAASFVKRHRTTFSAILWLDGRSEFDLRQGLADYGSEVWRGQRLQGKEPSHKQLVALALDWLSDPGNARWLVVLDDVGGDCGVHDSISGDYVKKYLPDNCGSALVTTRLTRLSQLGPSRALQPVSPVVGLKIIKNWIGYHNAEDAESDLSELVATLGDLPLALAQAGSYLRETGTSATAYLDLYLHNWADLIGCDNGTAPCVLDYRFRDIRSTWCSSFLAIKAKDESAGKLLLLWSCLDCKDLWYGLLRDAADDSDVAPTYPRWLTELASNEARFLRSMRLILSCSLAQKNEIGGYQLNPVVHRWIAHLRSPSELERFGELAVRITSSAAPARTFPRFWELQKRILHHADRCALWLEGKVSGGCLHDSKLVRPLVALGTLYSDQYELDRAEWMLSRAVDAQDSPDVALAATILRMLAGIYARQHRFVDAASTYQFLLEGLSHDVRHSSGNEHCSSMWIGEESVTMILDALQDCAKFYLDCRGHMEAESLFNCVLKYRESKEPATLIAKNDLGCVYASQGRFEDAELQFRRVFKSQDELFGPRHPFTLHTMNNIGLLHAIQGRFKDGEVLCRHAKKMYDGSLGQNHPVAQLIASNIEILVTKRSTQHVEDSSGSATSVSSTNQRRISHDVQRDLHFCSSKPITPMRSEHKEGRHPENQHEATHQGEPTTSGGEDEQNAAFPALFKSAVALRELLAESAAVTSPDPLPSFSGTPTVADDASIVKAEEE